MARKIKKLGADAVQEAALGHNSKNDELLKESVEKVAKKERSVTAIKGDIKQILNDAKADGFKKMAIRRAVKKLEMTEEQKQAREEIDVETDYITELCAGLPLFHKSAMGQAA